jgi:hypothetical protein
MPILVETRPSPADYTRKGGVKRWRDSWLEDHRLWLAPYFEPEAPPIQKCPHGNGVGLDCTVCRPYYVSWDGRKRVPSKQVRVDLTGRPLYFLRRFHRTFDYRIEEHYVSPYDSHFRRSGITEYAGGYITAGWGDDGIAIHAPTRKYGPTDDDFEMRWDEFYRSETGSISCSGDGTFAEVPAPDAGCEWIDLFRFSTSRATRVIPVVLWQSGPVVLLFKDERKAEPVTSWKPDKKFIHWTRPSPQVLLTSPMPPRWTTLFLRSPAPTPQPIPRRVWSVGDWLRVTRGTLLPEIPERPSDKELARRNYGPSVGMRVRTPLGWLTVVRPAAGNRAARKPWSHDWRTERKMRDTAAGLKMYEYGSDGLINVRRMQDAARENYAAAWRARSKACGIDAKQTFWPGDRIPRGSNESRPVDGSPAEEASYFKNPEQRLGTSTG